MSEVLEHLEQTGIVPVIALDDAAAAVPLARALAAGGLPAAEVTFRTPAAADAIAAIAAEVPEVLVGAGTVLTCAQVDEALEAGARFVVSPGFNPRTVDYALEKGTLMMPGISNASGVEQALERGLSTVKFFPAEPAGGLPYIKALAGPYGGVRYMPTGGINPGNVADYLACPHVICCGGTWMAPKELVAKGRFDEIARLCREAADLVAKARG